MSIDIDIIPLRPNKISWANLRSRWIYRLGRHAGPLLGDGPLMRRLGTGSVVKASETLTPPLTCYFELFVTNTLSFTMLPNEEDLGELEYLEDYGRNLSPSDIELFARQWHQVGYSFGLTSSGGRSPDEPRMLVGLSCALADVCDGRVIIMNDGLFNLGVGIYTSEQFSHAEWRIC